jgi:hypothetical protein
VAAGRRAAPRSTIAGPLAALILAISADAEEAINAIDETSKSDARTIARLPAAS